MKRKTEMLGLSIIQSDAFDLVYEPTFSVYSAVFKSAMKEYKKTREKQKCGTVCLPCPSI